MDEVARLLNRMVEAGVIALSVGRAKDFARVLALREVGAISDEEVSTLAERHGLAGKWRTFRERFDEK